MQVVYGSSFLVIVLLFLAVLLFVKANKEKNSKKKKDYKGLATMSLSLGVVMVGFIFLGWHQHKYITMKN